MMQKNIHPLQKVTDGKMTASSRVSWKYKLYLTQNLEIYSILFHLSHNKSDWKAEKPFLLNLLCVSNYKLIKQTLA